MCQKIQLLLFSRKFGDKYSKKLMDTATKAAKTVIMDAAKTVSKRVVQKMAEETGDLVGNKKVDKINSAGNQKVKEKKKIIKQMKH